MSDAGDSSNAEDSAECSLKRGTSRNAPRQSRIWMHRDVYANRCIVSKLRDFSVEGDGEFDILHGERTTPFCTESEALEAETTRLEIGQLRTASVTDIPGKTQDVERPFGIPEEDKECVAHSSGKNAQDVELRNGSDLLKRQKHEEFEEHLDEVHEKLLREVARENACNLLSIFEERFGEDDVHPSMRDVIVLESGKRFLKSVAKYLFSAREECGGTWIEFACAVGHCTADVMVIVNNFRQRYFPLGALPPHQVFAECAAGNHGLRRVLAAIKTIGRNDILCRNDLKEQLQELLSELPHRPADNGALEQLEPSWDEDAASYFFNLLLGVSEDGFGTKSSGGSDQRTQTIQNVIRVISGANASRSSSFLPGPFNSPTSASLPNLPGSRTDGKEERIEFSKIKITEGPLVLLIHANDAEEEARLVKKTFQSYSIAVLNISEHEDLLVQAMDVCCELWFGEVDFVIPLISREYLKAVAVPASHDSVADRSLQMVRYLHMLMQNELITQGINRRVRTLVSASLRDVSRIKELQRPVYSAWKSTEKMKDMANLIIRSVARKRIARARPIC